MNAVIACGGTGGHLFPGIAVAEVLQNRGHDVMLLVSEKDIDAVALSGRTNFKVEKLPTVGLPSLFHRRFLGSRAVLLKAYHFAALSIASSIHTLF
jgi:UDP-N-acetylglucosamine--N-acetylmuramyl-(pentapeptide) pyrophosphoryl-undecaprenol N-acetylglucosamine transferase